MFKTYSSSSSLVITSCWFATSRLRAPVSVRPVYYSHAILDQEIQNNGGCLEAAGPDRERFLQPRKYQKYPYHGSWLGNWLWVLIVKIQGYCYLKYREYLQKLYSLDTWCLTEQTNVLKSDTTTQIKSYMGPTWVLLAPGGPHVGPMNLAIRAVIESIIQHARYGQQCCISAVPSLTP